MSLPAVILIAGLGLAIALNYLRFRDAMYPAVIHSAMWTGVIILYIVHQDDLYPLSPVTYGIVVAGVFLFSAGCLLATRGHEPVIAKLEDIDFDGKTRYLDVLFWASLLGLIPFLAHVNELGHSGPFDSLYRNLRHASGEAETMYAGGAFGIWAYLLPVAFVNVAIRLLLEDYRRQRKRFYVSLGVALIYAFLVTGRTYVIFLAIVCLGIVLITRRFSVVKTAVIGLAVIVVVFLAMGLLAAKGGTIENGVVETDVETLWQIFVVYSLGPLPAFDGFIQMSADWTGGETVFRSVIATLAKLGLDVEPPTLVQAYSFVPFPTNVYTIYQPYYNDFGWAGLLIMPLVIGYVHGVIYRRATRGNLVFILVYALSLYPLLLQFFQDQYFSLLSFWVQFAVLISFFFYRFRLFAPELRPDLEAG